MSLNEIFCQEKALNILTSSYNSGKSAHSYIFSGQDGIGKLTTARQWAKFLLCQNQILKKDSVDSCGQCHSCTMFDAASHPDFHLLYKEMIEFTKDPKNRNKTNPTSFPIDVIREFLIEKTPTRPVASSRTVFIVTEAEKLQNVAQNSILKILEEPPSFCTIILICCRMENLLPTIKSRCQIIKFGPVSEDKIIQKLSDFDLNSEKTKYFAKISQASIGTAVNYAKLESAEPVLFDTKKQIIQQIVRYKYENSLDLANDLIKKSQQIAKIWPNLELNISAADIKLRSHKIVIFIIISVFYDCLQIQLNNRKNLINIDQENDIQNLAARLSPELCAEKIDTLYQAIRGLEANVNEKLIFEQLLLKMATSDTINAL